jgi:hypothetical protein
MATVSINWWPWGGVSVCFNEGELKDLFSADDTAAGIATLLTAYPNPAVQAAGAGIGAWLQVEKGVAEAVDQGGGVCFFLPWIALAFQQWWAVIPTALPPPQIWQGEAVTAAGLAPAGAAVAASQQFGANQQTDVFFVDKQGRLNVSWV